jgi:hypothetical protein
MHVQVVRTGGFAGIAQQAAVESARLDAAERDTLIRLVKEAAFFSLPAKIEAQAGGYDRFQYEITVEDGERRHTVACGETGMNAALSELARLVLTFRRKS